jgi:uncharacterized membrane-anchored protein
VLGWAFKPYYDKNRKILHWAKVVRFGINGENTLNYNVKILGRKGVLILTAIAPMSDLPLVQADINKIVDVVGFSESYRYQAFNPQMDKVAGNSIRGLISGNMLGRVDFLSILSQYWTLILIAIIAFFRPVWDNIRGFINEEPELSIP